MPGTLLRWLAPDCCEAVVDAPTGPDLFRRLAVAADGLRSALGAVGTTTGFTSLAVQWPMPVADRHAAEQRVNDALTRAWESALTAPPKRHALPLRYDGPDLGAVAARHGITAEEVAWLHAGTIYTVAAVGFMPHFAYLWGLPARLATPRRASPRPRVPLGAVGIAGDQTGVYPQVCPGGWNLIGRVPPAACAVLLPRLAVGDEVVFEVQA